MNRPFFTLLAALGALSLGALPGRAIAGSVGYAGSCSFGQSAYIAAAGHVAVPVTAYTATALAGLDALVVNECGARFTTNAAVNARVANGMALIVTDRPPGPFAASTTLPGMAPMDPGFFVGNDVNFPAASPILNGPGGVLTNATLDSAPVCFPTIPGQPPFCIPFFPAYLGSLATSTLPAGSRVLATSESASQATAFSYAYGRGRVVYSTVLTDFPSSGAAQYMINLVAWAAPNFITCAAEGYSGTKLTLCRQVCEMNYTGTKLNALIKAWVLLYHTDPPCAR